MRYVTHTCPVTHTWVSGFEFWVSGVVLRTCVTGCAAWGFQFNKKIVAASFGVPAEMHNEVRSVGYRFASVCYRVCFIFFVMTLKPRIE